MYILLGLLFLYQCNLSAPTAENRKNPVWEPIENHQGMAKAYFASGCFWCVEYIYESLTGVEEAFSGYAGGKTKNPNYYQITTGRTGHAETVEVIYNSDVISFKALLEVFFDPTKLLLQLQHRNPEGPRRPLTYVPLPRAEGAAARGSAAIRETDHTGHSAFPCPSRARRVSRGS